MSRTFSFLVAIVLTGTAYLQAATPQSASPASSAASPYRAVLNRYCVTCHNEKLKTAGLMLDKTDVDNVPAGAETWEKVIRKLRSGAMPPVGMPRPDQGTYDSFATYLETAIDREAAAKTNPGRNAAVHRLNRTEYTNAIRDMLALEIEGESLLPADDSGYGFDNNADVLSMSPLLMERYMSVGRWISRLAIGDTTIRPEARTYNLPHLLLQGERMSEDLPFGSRGGAAIKYHFPVDAEYVLTIGLRKNDSPLNSGSIVGLSEAHQLEVRVDGALVKRLTVGGDQTAKARSTSSPVDPHAEKTDGLEVRFPARAGTRVVGVAFINDIMEPDAESEVVVRPQIGQLYDFWRFQDGNPSVESVVIGGPYKATGPGDTQSRRKIFVCRPTAPKHDEVCAKKIIAMLERQAYRRPVTDTDVQPQLSLYRSARKIGSFEAGIGAALQGILVSPKFLFRIERDAPNLPPGSAYRVSDLELASRLSFFLWSSIPDEPLLDAAEHGKLKDPAVLEQQVRRMLADSRSNALINNFFGQWLQLRNLESAQPDIATFPDFDENLREALIQESKLFLESMVREDHPLIDLLNANYSFVNDRLARHYGLPNVYGSFFRRVTLNDEKRWGLLGKGGILILTSYPNRTSPVLRGKFVLENIMGSPPPPPPPNVPPLKETGDDGKKLTVRQLMEQHRASSACAGCHARMDPLGFALDNFDATGRWRTTEANAPIDSSGSLPDGTKFQGVAELRKILLSHPESFVNTVTENLMTYALGRGVEYYDLPAVRKIVRDSAPGNYRWSSLVVGVVNSPPFQMRKLAEPVAAAALQ